MATLDVSTQRERELVDITDLVLAEVTRAGIRDVPGRVGLLGDGLD
jgi:thiamine phosphate synthase YjbQ (UPF0047 family)